ncbi:TPA: AAA family ATPase [Candidatus Woesearchaeota archaeon]|nr:AAA family ATPase [Candidatus Woesearchaeota archaeon]
MDKTGLARHTVLARLHRLIGEGKVRVRQINMAKLHFWSELPQPTSPVSSKESNEEIKENIVVTPLKEEHIEKVSNLKKKAPAAPIVDMNAIKEQIEQELKTGDLSKSQAEIKKQRAPLIHVIKEEKHQKEVRADEFIKTGIPGFDELFEHGIPRGNSVIIAGGAGSGKTIFCLQTLFKHASEGEKCLYMSFEESEERLMHHMEDFGWDPHPLIKKGNLLIKRFNPFDITRSVDALLMKAKGELLIDVEPIIFPEGFIPDIIVLDSLTAIASAFTGKEDSYRIYIEQLFRFFEQVKATSLLITETEQVPKMFSSTGVEEFLADGVIVLYAIKRGNIRENAIEVLKMRGEKHQKKIVALQISDAGITVYPEQEVFGGVGE